MVLGEVEETITTIEIDEETFEQIYRVSENDFEECFTLLFVPADKTTHCNVIRTW